MFFSTRKACVEYLNGAISSFAEKLDRVLSSDVDDRNEEEFYHSIEKLLEGLNVDGESQLRSSGHITLGYEPANSGTEMYEAILRYEITL